ncbi:MAG: MoaD/ThiS family protein [Bacillota bacterium]
MILEVRVFGGLEKRMPGAIYGKPIEMNVPGGTTVADLLRMLKIPEQDVFTTLVNGIHSNREYTLNPGDRVAFFPPVGGG